MGLYERYFSKREKRKKLGATFVIYCHGFNITSQFAYKHSSKINESINHNISGERVNNFRLEIVNPLLPVV